MGLGIIGREVFNFDETKTNVIIMLFSFWWEDWNRANRGADFEVSDIIATVAGGWTSNELYSSNIRFLGNRVYISKQF
jgi:hypothetical protein